MKTTCRLSELYTYSVAEEPTQVTVLYLLLLNVFLIYVINVLHFASKSCYVWGQKLLHFASKIQKFGSKVVTF